MKLDEADQEFTIELSYSWKSHAGMETRQRTNPSEHERAVSEEAAQFMGLMDAFQAAAMPIASECKRLEFTFNPKHALYFDGSIDTAHLINVTAARASAVPLSLIIKAARDVLVKWLDKRRTGISVKLGAGRAIDVRSTAELDEVLTRLDKTEFVRKVHKSTAKAAPKRQNATSRVITAKAKAKASSKRK